MHYNKMYKLCNIKVVIYPYLKSNKRLENNEVLQENNGLSCNNFFAFVWGIMKFYRIIYKWLIKCLENSEVLRAG